MTYHKIIIFTKMICKQIELTKLIPTSTFKTTILKVEICQHINESNNSNNSKVINSKIRKGKSLTIPNKNIKNKRKLLQYKIAINRFSEACKAIPNMVDQNQTKSNALC